MSKVCCCSLAGTKACDNCINNEYRNIEWNTYMDNSSKAPKIDKNDIIISLLKDIKGLLKKSKITIDK